MSGDPNESSTGSPAPSLSELRYPQLDAELKAFLLRSSSPSDPVEDAARAAAARLGDTDDRRLDADVDAALRSHRRSSSPVEPDRFVDPVSAGSLIVSVATLAWTVYTDLRSRSEKPSPDLVVREVRARLRRHGKADPASYEDVITITVEETVKAAAAAIDSSSHPVTEPPHSGDHPQP